jgi:AcrR family transcriptional regulator
MPHNKPTHEPGLRERKRADTRFRIEQAALKLVLERGLDATTIDAVAAAAGISQRTFFNYFESKEAALLGLTGLDPAGHVNHPITAENFASDVVGIVLDTVGATALHPDLLESRREVLRRYPEVSASASRARKDLHQHLVTLIRQHLQTEVPLERSTVLAAVIAGVCLTAVKVAYREADDTATVHSLQRESVTLINDALMFLR